MFALHQLLRRIGLLLVFALGAAACSATAEVTLMTTAVEQTQLETSAELSDPAPDISVTVPDEPIDMADPSSIESALGQPDDGVKGDETEDSEVGRDPALPEQPANRESPLDAPPEIDDNPFADPVNGGGIDFRLTRNDLDCDEDDLSAYPDTPFLVAHVVVDGNLGEPCFGEPDERLITAWQILAGITPAGQLHDLGMFGGYISAERGETTLAFVNALDYEGSQFQMSINLEEAEADPDELMLTMAHEFSHVFTSLSTQIDRYELPDDCDTWDNGEGCYRDDSIMWEWIELFWGNGLIDQIDPYDSPTSSAGAARCNIDPAFLGSYAASGPEEDFAESFSAFVFRLDVNSPELQAKMEWFALQPGLVEFRNLAVEAGLGPLNNYFERCG